MSSATDIPRPVLIASSKQARQSTAPHAAAAAPAASASKGTAPPSKFVSARATLALSSQAVPTSSTLQIEGLKGRSASSQDPGAISPRASQRSIPSGTGGGGMIKRMLTALKRIGHKRSEDDEERAKEHAINKLGASEINRIFQKSLEELGVLDSAKIAQLQAYYSVAQKWDLIQSLKEDANLQAQTPEHFLSQFKRDPANASPAIMKLLRDRIQRADKDWAHTYVINSGIQALLEVVRYRLYKISSPLLREMALDAECIELSVSCLIKLIRHRAITGIATNEFLKVKDSIKLLLLCVEHGSSKTKGDVFLLIAGILVLSANSNETILGCIRSVALPEQDYFQPSILHELRTGTDVDFKVSYLTFVNTVLAILAGRLAERNIIREKYLGSQVVNFLRELKDLYPDPTLQVLKDFSCKSCNGILLTLYFSFNSL